MSYSRHLKTDRRLNDSGCVDATGSAAVQTPASVPVAGTAKKIVVKRRPQFPKNDQCGAELKVGPMFHAAAGTTDQAARNSESHAAAPVCDCKHPYTIAETDLLYQAALRACEDPQEIDAPTDGDAGLDEPGPYHRWGGLLMTMSSMPGGLDALPPGDRVSVLRSKIDKLDQLATPLQFADFCRVMRELELTNEDVNYLNSPLLDGLYLAYTGCAVVPTSAGSHVERFLQSPAINLASALHRICSSSPPVLPAAFKLLWSCTDRAAFEVSDYGPLLIAACRAHQPRSSLFALRTVALATQHSRTVVDKCLRDAFTRSNLLVFDTLWKLSDDTTGKQIWETLLACACGNSSTELVHAICSHPSAKSFNFETLVNCFDRALSERNTVVAHELGSFFVQLAPPGFLPFNVLLASVRANCPHLADLFMTHVETSSELRSLYQYFISADICLAAVANRNLDLLSNLLLRASLITVTGVPLRLILSAASDAVKLGDASLVRAILGLSSYADTQGKLAELVKTAAEYGQVDAMLVLLGEISRRDELILAMKHVLSGGSLDCVRALLQCTVNAALEPHLDELIATVACRVIDGDLVLAVLMEYCTGKRLDIHWPSALATAARLNSKHLMIAALQSADITDADVIRAWKTASALVPAVRIRSIAVIGQHCFDHGLGETVFSTLLQLCGDPELNANRDAIVVLASVLKFIDSVGVFNPQRAATLVSHARHKLNTLKELLSSNAVLKLVPVSVVVAAVTRHTVPDEVYVLLSRIAARALHRVKSPQRLMDAAFIQAIKLKKPDIALEWLRRGADLHADSDIAFLLALHTNDHGCLSALLHRREHPHKQVPPSDTGSVIVQCDCAMMSGARYLVELWSRDRSLSQRSDSSRILGTNLRDHDGARQCIGYKCAASHGALLFASSLDVSPRSQLFLKQFVAKCLSQRLWRSLELCFRDLDGNIRAEVVSVLPELLSTMRTWVSSSEYGVLEALLTRNPDWEVAEWSATTDDFHTVSALQPSSDASASSVAVSSKSPGSRRPATSGKIDLSWRLSQ